MARSDKISDEELLYLAGQMDAKLFKEGLELRQRQWEVPQAVMKEFGYISYILAGHGTPEILKRINNIFKSIYRKQDLAMGGHIGVFMYKDIFAKISIPRIFGEVAINPFEFVELTPIQQRIIQTESEQIAIYLDQFFDVADIEYGSDELNSPFGDIELTKRFIGLSRLHLHAAAAVVTGGYDHRGAVQSALLATELALKAAVSSQNLNEDEIRDKFGHKLAKIVEYIATFWTNFDSHRVMRVINTQPKYVMNRYSELQPSRIEVGHTIMGAQYVVSEIVRQMSDRDFRSGINPPLGRTYPI